MTESDEIAASIAASLPAGTIPKTHDECIALVRGVMPGEGTTIISNVAWSLLLCGQAVRN